MLRYLSILALFAFYSIAGISQESRQYSFTHFSTVNGLAANFVNNIVQDDRGYMWLATINGLQRYDGNNFLTFTHDPEDSNSIPAENVYFVYKDHKGRLWLATIDNSIGIFDTENFQYHKVPVDWVGAPVYFFHKGLVELSDGSLLVFSPDYGEYVFDEKKGKFEKNEIIPSPPYWRKNAISEDTFTHRYWMACDSGVAVYNPKTKTLSYRDHNLESDPLIARIGHERNFYYFNTDRLGRYFFHNWPNDRPGPRWMYYNTKTKDFGDYYLGEYMPIGYFEIGGVYSQRNGRLWLHGASFLAQFQENAAQPFLQVQNEYKGEQSIKFDRLLTIFEDNQNNLWLSTENGVYVFNPDAQFFSSFSLLHPGEKRNYDLSAISALEMKNGNLWVGSWSSGIYYYDENLNAIPIPKYMEKYQAPYSFWSMLQDNLNDDVWMGLQGGSLVRANPVKQTSEMATPPIFNARTVRQLAEDHDGNIWMGTQNGMVIKWDRKAAHNDINKGYTKVFQTGMIMKLLVDKEGYIWVAGMSYGVFKIDPVTGKVVEHFHRLSTEGKTLWNDSPHDLFIYNDSMMMVCNDALTLINMHTNKVKQITTKEGLPSNTTRCIQRDGKGNFWIGMLNGIVRMNLEKQVFTYYDRRDGIVYDNFISAGAFSMRDGRIVFATEHNFLAFDPSKVIRTTAPNNVQITDFKLGNKALRVDSLRKLDEVKLRYDNTSILFEFNDLNFVKQNKIRYFYKLEGIDKDWIIAEDNHQAVYTWLPPGDYVFRVNCQNGDGIWSKDITTMKIHVSHPFWRTWWFYGILVLVAAGILYGIDRERIQRMRSMQQMRSQIAGNLHQEINTTLSSISLLSEMAKMKADKDLTRSKEYIDKIGEKSQNMIVAMDDILWSIQPENDSMEKTVLRVEEFVDALRNRYGTVIELQVDKRARNLQLEMKTRHEFFLIFKEALKTLVQLAGAKEVLIYLDFSVNKLALKTQAPGTSLDTEDLQIEKSLLEMEKRASLIGAVLDVQADARASNIILLLPVV